MTTLQNTQVMSQQIDRSLTLLARYAANENDHNTLQRYFEEHFLNNCILNNNNLRYSVINPFNPSELLTYFTNYTTRHGEDYNDLVCRFASFYVKITLENPVEIQFIDTLPLYTVYSLKLNGTHENNNIVNIMCRSILTQLHVIGLIGNDLTGMAEEHYIMSFDVYYNRRNGIGFHKDHSIGYGNNSRYVSIEYFTNNVIRGPDVLITHDEESLPTNYSSEVKTTLVENGSVILFDNKLMFHSTPDTTQYNNEPITERMRRANEHTPNVKRSFVRCWVSPIDGPPPMQGIIGVYDPHNVTFPSFTNQNEGEDVGNQFNGGGTNIKLFNFKITGDPLKTPIRIKMDVPFKEITNKEALDKYISTEKQFIQKIQQQKIKG